MGAWTNFGTVAIDPGTQLEVAPDGTGRDTFTQAGGLVAADGRMIVDGGLFHFTGGGLMGDFTVRDGWIRVDPGVTQPSTVYVVGHSNTLLDDASAWVTLRVQGGSPVGDGDAVLTAADGATNFGTIVLESLDGVFHGYFRVPQGRFTNGAGGQIQVSLPPGDSGQDSVTAGWLEDDGGGVADTTGLPVEPDYQAALDAANAAAADGDASSIDPTTALYAVMAETPGAGDGVIGVGGVSGPNGEPPNGEPPNGDDGGDGLIGVLENFGDVVINSVEAPLQTAGNILDGATGGLWSQEAVPALTSAWQAAKPYVEQYALPFLAAAGQFVRQNVLPVTAPLIQGAAARVAALPQAALELGAIIHDGVASVLAATSPWWAPVLGGEPYRPDLWSAFAHGYQQAQAEGRGLEYAINAELNAATFGLYGALAAFGPALQQAQAAGSAAPLLTWLGGTAVDVALNPLTGLALGAASEAAAGEWTSGEAGSAARLGAEATAWSAEAASEAQLGETAAGEQATTEAGSEAQLGEAVQSAEATVEQTAASGFSADAGQVAEAEVAAAQAEAAARGGIGTEGAALDKAAAVDAATAEVQQAEQACQAQEAGLLGGCFAAGTPLLTPGGAVAVEQLKKGDSVLSRAEHDQDGPVEARQVAEVYRRLAAVWQLRLRGRVIGATGEHPFWVKDKGWAPVRLLQAGDWLRTHDGEWVTVEGVRETTEVVVVYNLQVAEHHTYFVGSAEWGFSAWAHNVVPCPGSYDPAEAPPEVPAPRSAYEAGEQLGESRRWPTAWARRVGSTLSRTKALSAKASTTSAWTPMATPGSSSTRAARQRSAMAKWDLPGSRETSPASWKSRWILPGTSGVSVGEICSKTPWTLATYGASLTPHRLRRLEERDQRPSSTPGAIHHDATVHTAGGLSPPGRMAGQHRKLPRHDRGKTKQDLGAPSIRPEFCGLRL